MEIQDTIEIPSASWSKEKLECWLKTYKEGKYLEYLKGLDGRDLLVLTKQDLEKYCGGIMGIVLHNFIHTRLTYVKFQYPCGSFSKVSIINASWNLEEKFDLKKEKDYWYTIIKLPQGYYTFQFCLDESKVVVNHEYNIVEDQNLNFIYVLNREKLPNPEEYISSYYSPCNEVIENILNMWKSKNVILVRSPPLTGKTMLAYLLTRHLYLLYPNAPISYIELGGVIESFEKIWSSYYPESFTDFTHRNIPCYLIFDEVQNMYNFSEDPFWNRMKTIIDSAIFMNIKIICFAGYGSQLFVTKRQTPIQFNRNNGCIFSLDLLCREENVNTICKKFENTKFPLEKIEKRIIANNTNGHLGFIDLLLKKRMELGYVQWIRYINSMRMYEDIRRSRALAGFSSRSLKGDDINFLKHLVINGSVYISGKSESVIDNLIRSGYICELSEGCLSFSCEMVCKAVQYALFCSVDRPSKSMYAKLDEFMLGALAKIRKSQLANTRSLVSNPSYDKKADIGLVSEKMWQCEFYYAASTILSDGVFLSYEKGIFTKKKGKKIKNSIDFEIHNCFVWGIEFLIETNSTGFEEHIERFTLLNKYAREKFDDWIVVEFRRKCESWVEGYFPKEAEERINFKRSQNQNTNFWIVFYEPDFSKLYVFFPNVQKPMTITLQPD